MAQQILAFFVLLFFVIRLFFQRNRKEISNNEFVFWLLFWGLASMAIIFIKKIDAFVASLGFSGAGIDVLIYLGVALLFYLVFRLRIKMEKMDKNITKIVRELSLQNKSNKNEGNKR